jgi:hypothetical protein
MRITVQCDEDSDLDYNSVVGYSLVTVVKTQDGGLDVNRDFRVQDSWNEEDKQVATDFLKKAEDKISELFPEESVPESKLWVPDGY